MVLMYLPYKNVFWKLSGEVYYAVEAVLELLSIPHFNRELKGLILCM